MTRRGSRKSQHSVSRNKEWLIKGHWAQPRHYSRKKTENCDWERRLGAGPHRRVPLGRTQQSARFGYARYLHTPTSVELPRLTTVPWNRSDVCLLANCRKDSKQSFNFLRGEYSFYATRDLGISPMRRSRGRSGGVLAGAALDLRRLGLVHSPAWREPHTSERGGHRTAGCSACPSEAPRGCSPGCSSFLTPTSLPSSSSFPGRRSPFTYFRWRPTAPWFSLCGMQPVGKPTPFRKPRRLTPEIVGELLRIHSSCVHDQAGKCPLLVSVSSLTWELNQAANIGNEKDNAFRRTHPMCAARPIAP